MLHCALQLYLQDFDGGVPDIQTRAFEPNYLSNA